MVRKIVSLLTLTPAVLVFTITPLFLSGCGKDEATVAPSVRSGQVEVVTVMPLTTDEIGQFPQEEVSFLEASGWVRTERGFEHREPLTEFTVRSAGVEQTIADDGTFVFGDASDLTLRYQGLDVVPSPSLAIHAMGDGAHIALTLDLGEHLAGHAGHEGMSASRTGSMSPETYVPCNDYNGPWGDQHDYSSGPQRYINFVGSDCWSAWPVCYVRDFTWWPYCNGSRNCSSLIGHCSGYHRHTYPGGPSC